MHVLAVLPASHPAKCSPPSFLSRARAVAVLTEAQPGNNEPDVVMTLVLFSAKSCYKPNIGDRAIIFGFVSGSRPSGPEVTGAAPAPEPE